MKSKIKFEQSAKPIIFATSVTQCPSENSFVVFASRFFIMNMFTMSILIAYPPTAFNEKSAPEFHVPGPI